MAENSVKKEIYCKLNKLLNVKYGKLNYRYNKRKTFVEIEYKKRGIILFFEKGVPHSIQLRIPREIAISTWKFETPENWLKENWLADIDQFINGFLFKPIVCKYEEWKGNKWRGEAFWEIPNVKPVYTGRITITQLLLRFLLIGLFISFLVDDGIIRTTTKVTQYDP